MGGSLIAADLFCGAGGLSVGFAQAGCTIVFANDVDEDCRRTYVRNHSHPLFFPGSIEDLSAKDIFKATGLGRGEIDILIGGPPCQGFSINAPRRSEKDDRNRLFMQYGRLVLEGIRPKVILMENVPGMLSLEGGRFVNAIYNLFGQAGYRMEHMVLCAAHYGVPQERWRLFFIGTILKGKPITFPFPSRSAPVRANFTGGRDLTWLTALQNGNGNRASAGLFHDELKEFVTVRDAISDLPSLGILDGSDETPYQHAPKSDYQSELRRGSTILFNHVAGTLSKQNLDRLGTVNK
jgi:DNA (cytosine-5)-methyltransferase 1